MKTFIFSLLVLTMIISIAQPNTIPPANHILIQSKNHVDGFELQNDRIQVAVIEVETIEILFQKDEQLNAELDKLLLVNKSLEVQNQALVLRNQQLKRIDPIAIGQNNKLIHHNEKLISKNEVHILQLAVLIQANQNLITFQLQMMESFAMENK